jgi:hypothetical protein
LARAKHTDRTEARRRYRAEQAALAAADEVGEPETLAPNTLARDATKPAAGKAPGTAITERPSITGAFRTSFRLVDLRGDLRALPQIVTQWAFLAAIAVAIGAAAWFALAYGPAVAGVAAGDTAGLEAVIRANSTPWLLFGLAVTPPPAAGAFVIGFTARRASWLGGLLFGVAAAICYTVVIMTPAGRLLTADNPAGYFIASAFAYGPIGAMLFASAAAWYKRFLNLANPNRGRRPAKAQPKQKSRASTAKAGGRVR